MSALIVTLIAGVFVLDLLTPLGWAVWALYMVPLLLVYRLQQQQQQQQQQFPFLYLVAASATVLTIAGFFLSPPGIAPPMAITNRAIGIAVFWAAALVLKHLLRKNAALSASTEITARKQAEVALLKAGALQNAIFTSANFSSIATDAKGVIQIFNVGAERMLGYTAADVMNKITPADISDPQEVIARAKALSVELGTPITPGFEALVFKASRGIEDIYELTYIRKDGSRFPAVVSVTALRDAQNAIIGYLLIGTDNTARKQAEEQQARLGKEIRLLLESTGEGIYGIDMAGRCTFINKAGARVLGYEADEMRGRPMHDLIHHSRPDGSPYPVVECPTHQAFRTGQGCSVENEVLWRRDGTAFPAAYASSPIVEAEAVRGAVVTFSDITERKKMETALRETNVELDAFAYTVAHDLRAPLRALQGFGQALLEDYADRLDKVGKGYIQRIAGAAQRMDTLTQDLLTYSRLSRENLALTPVPLEAVLSGVLAYLKDSVQEKHAQVIVDKPLPEVIGHHSTLAQVVANLVANGVKYVAPGVQPMVSVRAVERAGWIRLCVEDNGIGIAPEHQDRIFRVFERLHGSESYPGTGVGLAIVRKGMERMGGRSGVESEAGKDSRFWIELPKSG